MLACLLLGMAGVSSVHAQYEIKSGVYNRLSNRVPATNTAHIPPVGPSGTPSGDPVITPQYSNVVESSGGSARGTTGYPTSIPANSSAPTGLTLTHSSFGTTFASGVPRYLFGDQITPPTTIVSAAGTSYTVDASYWRAQPVIAGEVLANPDGNVSPVDFKTGDAAAIPALPEGVLASYYYSPHAKRVFANTPGPVEITWRSAVPDSAKTGSNSYVYYKERFTVSSATSTPVRTMYWTEKSFTAPVIQIPTGRITTVNPVYSNIFPATVAKEYVVAGVSTSDPNAESSEILRTLWYENTAGSGTLHAYNLTGRIFVEYLGALNSQDGTYEFLGADVVSVEQSLRATTRDIILGQEIRPPRPDDDPTLTATPVSNSGSVNQISYYGSSVRADGTLAYYAERENTVEDNVTFYWMSPLDAAIPNTPEVAPGLVISWPKYLSKYTQRWPATTADEYEQYAYYAVNNGGSTLATGTGLQFGDGMIPQVIYQDSPDGEATIDNASQRLIINLGTTADQQNRTLLKFTGSNGGVWYVPLLTQSENNANYIESDGSGALTGTVYVGERVTPPSSAFSVAGYVTRGTSYSPQAYINPFLNGVAAAEAGAIIPVNTLAGENNALNVWWFKEVKPPTSEFSSFYTPAKIGRYTVAYRTTNQITSEDFESNATGWSTATRSTNTVMGGFLGPFGNYTNNGTTNIAVTSRNYSMGSNYQNGANLSFKFHRLETWENEYFKTFINDVQIINEPFGMTEVTTTRQGTVLSNGVNYAWTIIPIAGSYKDFYGTLSTKDQSFLVNITATPTSVAAAESISSMKIGFGSNLNSAAGDECFAVDDVLLQVTLPRIVMASRLGAGSLPSAVAAGSIYRQSDPTKTGYNPNEEHALLIGSTAYALRDDLNIVSGTSFSSLPRVLIQYTDPTDKRPAMSVFEVMREDGLYKLSYPVTAGTRMDAIMPAPLGVLPLPADPVTGAVKNVEVDPGSSYHETSAVAGLDSAYYSFTYKDRKGYDWVHRGPMAGGSPALGMHFYYNMQTSFDFPAGLHVSTPAAGTPLPYLRPKNTDGSFLGDPVTGDPVTVLYYPAWPLNPPTLSLAETLALSKNGLPAVRGQTSARVLYQQSVATGGSGRSSVILHDPTRAKTVLLNSSQVQLAALPGSLKTTSQNGKTYFQLAPPHLQQRIYLNPLLGDIGGLELVGEFVDSIAGEDYLNLNTLSPADVAALKGLVLSTDADRQKWNNAIDALTTRVETFKEDPAKPGTYIVGSGVDVNGTTLSEISSSDTAVDSYALSATGKGSGYVTLLFSDGKAFTPPGNGVDMKVIKVLDTLYKGDLKKILPANPLDEQVTLRHSGDFAAHPENYDFEWYYYPSQGGAAPQTYVHSTARVIGTTGSPATNTWAIYPNPPTDPLPDTLITYPATPAETLPKTYSVNGGTYTPERPGLLFKNVTGLNFDAVPEQVVFSAKLHSLDGFIVYVNGHPALAYQLPQGMAVPGGLTPQASRTGLTTDGLDYQFEIAPSFFNTGGNRIEVAVYSSYGANSPANTIDFRVDIPTKVEQVSSRWILASNTPLTNTVMIGGSANSIAGNTLLVFSDNYFTMRYKPKAGVNMVGSTSLYSEWMEPVLVESWVKRVLDGINPFNQRNTDLYNNPVSTDVSILTQAGKRWEGDVALNIDNINDFGLIEIYETVLNRVKAQSIDAGVNDASVNQTLQLAAGYLSDLYMTLGNEAWDDAQNPTLMIDDQLESSEVSSARFSFEGQVAKMMDETLGLLRGRDDFGSQTTVSPAYNRLYWNYINGITSGEPIYATNYAIKEKAGSANADGVIDASDAQAMFPQGHGDAYGHYLTALTGYYKLLTSPNFDWLPKAETVSILGQTVEVDYQDERKFATAAAALARTGAEILDFTARNDHTDGEEHGWSHFHEARTNTGTGVTRHWGVDEWSSRAFQGTYLNWVSANAMLPDLDTVNEGIEKIDRTTVPELNEMVTTGSEILSLIANLQAHLNPLGLANDSMAFDISPSEVAAGKSHFEQIYDRAIKASVNAKNAFQQAGKMNRQLRLQNTSLDEYNTAVEKQEDAYEYQLIQLYGTAYAGDIGAGKLYAQGYTGPDLYHSYFIDRPSPIVNTDSTVTMTFREPVNTDPFRDWSLDPPNTRLNADYVSRSYTISKFSLGQFSDTVASGLGRRGQTGDIQAALLDCYEAQVNLRDSASTFNTLMNRFNRDYQLYSEFNTEFETADAQASEKSSKAGTVRNAAFSLTTAASAASLYFDYIGALAAAAAEAVPTSVGLATDAMAPARGAIRISGETAALVSGLIGLTSDTGAALLEMQAANLDGEASSIMDEYNRTSANKQHIVELERLYDEVLATGFEMTRRLTQLQRANEKVSRLYANAANILTERESFRQRAASVIQGYRTRDVVYRDMRNEELSQYKGLFDLAQTFTYLAAKAYDYETGLLSTSQGEDVVNQIIGTYSVGDFQDDRPVQSSSGDVGLAGILGQLSDEWSVVKGRLGINNPDRNGTVFSLRQELFRIRTDQPTADDDLLWKQVIQQHIMSNVLNDPDVAIYCNNIRKTSGASVPGIVIPFSTTIEQGLNFFGWPLAAGDHVYTQSNFATKIASAGLVFKGYIGMDAYATGVMGAGGPASSNPNALSATPYAYLIPAGMDTMRSPPLGDTNIIRSWTIKDQAIPLPKNLGANLFSDSQFFTPGGSLNEAMWIPRKHGAFRAVDDPAYFYSSVPAEFTNSRLIGRSVWNTQWKIVIPAYSLLNDEQTGLDRFAQSVKDIQLFLRSYSNSGN
ncbi:hypothetical protein GCM10023212_06880 [Luteolibacter yonseiensis]